MLARLELEVNERLIVHRQERHYEQNSCNAKSCLHRSRQFDRELALRGDDDQRSDQKPRHHCQCHGDYYR